jgi:hypothetical protein
MMSMLVLSFASSIKKLVSVNSKMVESNEFNKDPLRVESFWESLSEKNCLNKVQSQEIRRLLKKMMKK